MIHYVAMTVGYSGTPLSQKLGIKDGSEIYLLDPPNNYRSWIEPMPADVTIATRLSKNTDMIHIFTSSKSALSRALEVFRRKMKSDAAVWVSWPKKSSKVPTDITEDTVREVALPLGFVDIKVCAVTEVWSGLKLVIRKELRK
jgi:hypothetical protein